MPFGIRYRRLHDEVARVDLTFSEADEQFRTEFRGWLAENLPMEWRERGFWRKQGEAGFEMRRKWDADKAKAGFAGIQWPKEFGGRGGTRSERAIYDEEMVRHRAPLTVNGLGLTFLGPTVMNIGSDEQKRDIIKPLLHNEVIWCQGFSEPNSGSDLASLQCRAELDGDHFVINGQKTWNTLGHFANWCELLVRTDPEAPKHRGISCLLVDMTLPGVEVRPLITITGENEFNEIFFTDVRVPVSALLGPLHDGWRVAMTTLAYERGTVANLHLGLRGKIRRLIGDAAAAGALDDPVKRQSLAALYLEGELLKLVSERAISGAMHGRPMGPEGSIAKLVWSEAEQRVGEVAGEVLGADANTGSWGRDRVYMRALTIAGGTTQVNKNIVAQRILGMPRG